MYHVTEQNKENELRRTFTEMPLDELRELHHAYKRLAKSGSNAERYAALLEGHRRERLQWKRRDSRQHWKLVRRLEETGYDLKKLSIREIEHALIQSVQDLSVDELERLLQKTDPRLLPNRTLDFLIRTQTWGVRP